jgi:fusion and transport protein UGO1
LSLLDKKAAPMTSGADDTAPKYSHAPYPQSKVAHPLRPYFVAPNTDHIYVPVAKNIGKENAGQETIGPGDFVGEGAHNAIREFARFAFLRYVSVAIANPFQVAKTLLQVQYLPNEDVVPVATTPSVSDVGAASEDEVRLP